MTNAMLNRVWIVPILVFLGACSDPGSQSASRPAETNAPAVVAGGETLRGERLDNAGGMSVFRGIPYAAPPVGSLRWRPPAPHTPRAGEQDATSFGKVCPQTQSNAEWYRTVAEMFGASPAGIPPTSNIDEDCLYLNVWTTSVNGEPELPVMVWIHGGGNRDGYAHEPDYHGHGLAAKGVVVVSINYRLGLLGYMAHAGLSAESEAGSSGNYGILDQVAALQWVQDNIGAFGGDRDNVTLFGESAGGANIATLVASPLAGGLFRRAIIQSGGYEIGNAQTLVDAEAGGARIAATLGMDERLSPVETVAGMREMDWQTFIDADKVGNLASLQGPNVDGHVLPRPKSALISSDARNTANVIVGTNANENYMWQDPDATADSFREHIASYGEPAASELGALLDADIEADLQLAMDRLGSAETFLCGSRFIANELAADGGVYFYYFNRVRPGGDKVLAYHGAEIPYALDTAAAWLPADDTDRMLTDAMTGYWVNFARSGNPNGAGLPEWPRYENASRRHLEFGDEIRPGGHVEAGICDVLDRHRKLDARR